jgi:hypothetical protein
MFASEEVSLAFSILLHLQRMGSPCSVETIYRYHLRRVVPLANHLKNTKRVEQVQTKLFRSDVAAVCSALAAAQLIKVDAACGQSYRLAKLPAEIPLLEVYGAFDSRVDGKEIQLFIKDLLVDKTLQDLIGYDYNPLKDFSI